MPIYTVGMSISGVTETPEVLGDDLRQIKWAEIQITGVSEIPAISLIGLNTFISAGVESEGKISIVSSRDRERSCLITQETEIPNISDVAVLPEKYESVGALSYGGKPFKSSTIRQGTYVPLTFEVTGDRLTADMDVVLTVEDLGKNILFSKQVKLGVFDENVVSLPDGKDSISGTITIVPEDTKKVVFSNFVELKYSLRLRNANVRNYVIEKGIFILEEV